MLSCHSEKYSSLCFFKKKSGNFFILEDKMYTFYFYKFKKHLQKTKPLLPHGSVGKKSAYNEGDHSSIPGSGRSCGKGNGNPSSILAWRIPWTEEAGGYSPQRHKESDTRKRVRNLNSSETYNCVLFLYFWQKHQNIKQFNSIRNSEFIVIFL